MLIDETEGLIRMTQTDSTLGVKASSGSDKTGGVHSDKIFGFDKIFSTLTDNNDVF
jgi:hypothetical protein